MNSTLERIAYAIKERGISHNMLIDAFKISKTTLSDILLGRREMTDEFVTRLSIVINVDKAWLLGEHDFYTTLNNKVFSFIELKNYVDNFKANKKIIYSERLSGCLVERGISHTLLAKTIGVYGKSILLQTRGKTFPNDATLKSISEALSVSIDWLCGISDLYTTSEGEDISSHELSIRVKSGVYDPEVTAEAPQIDRFLLADRLRTIILNRGIKQMDLAQQSGVYQSMISNFLSGKTSPYMSTLIPLANALDVDLESLASTTGETYD